MFVMIRNNISKVASLCEIIADTFVWLKVDKSLFVFREDLYICGAYLPPINSSYHAMYDCDVFRLLEDKIIEYSLKGKICVVGDLNSRTSNLDDYIADDTVPHTLQDQLSSLTSYTGDLYLPPRVNPDTVRNDYGSKLVNLCKTT